LLPKNCPNNVFFFAIVKAPIPSANCEIAYNQINALAMRESTLVTTQSTCTYNQRLGLQRVEAAMAMEENDRCGKVSYRYNKVTYH
jgi:hypothetical protein